MTQEQVLARPILIYWWNMGSKTLDIKGTLKEALFSKDIVYRPLPKTKKYTGKVGWVFTFSVSCSTTTHEVVLSHLNVDYFERACLDMLVSYFKQLGDRTSMKYNNRGTTKINFYN